VAMLLAHTSGLPDTIHLEGLPTVAARRAAILTTALVPGVAPGTVYRYSDVNALVLGLILEKVTGEPLDRLVHDGITAPLGLPATGFVPTRWLAPADAAARMVATDATPVRGLLRGVVHDPNAYALGGVAGHAGLFSTATDLAVVCQMLINGGEYAGTRV